MMSSGRIQWIYDGKIVIGFAGTVADAFTLSEKFEEMLMDTTLLEETLAEIRGLYYVTDGGDT